MPHFARQRLFCVALAFFCTSFGALTAFARSSGGVRWERIHVYNAPPSVVFAKLGLTHSTKNGHTRDGKQGVPDPTFPPGLTDVVPYDADRLLLVRGTPGGLSLFRARVAAADVRTQPIHIHAELLGTGAGASLGVQEEDDVIDGRSRQITVGDGSAARVYLVTERQNPDGTFWVACRVSLPLPDQSAQAPTGAVFIPERIWTDPLSRRIHLGETAEFNDVGAVRAAAARRLGASGADADQDYVLRVTLTPSASQSN